MQQKGCLDGAHRRNGTTSNRPNSDPSGFIPLLDEDELVARHRYVQLMCSLPSPDIVPMFETEPQYARPTRRGLRQSVRAIQRVHRAACQFLGADAQAQLSNRRDQVIVFARAWTTFRVVEGMIASFEAIADYLHRAPPDLQLLVRRHQKRYPVFFAINRFPAGVPLINIARVGSG
jgi:hypothetical protein